MMARLKGVYKTLQTTVFRPALQFATDSSRYQTEGTHIIRALPMANYEIGPE